MLHGLHYSGFTLNVGQWNEKWLGIKEEKKKKLISKSVMHQK